MQPYTLTNIDKGGWGWEWGVKAQVSSWENLSQKEAELVLAGKETGWSHLFSQDLDYEPQNIGYTCVFIRLFVSSQLIRIYGHKFLCLFQL